MGVKQVKELKMDMIVCSKWVVKCTRITTPHLDLARPRARKEIKIKTKADNHAVTQKELEKLRKIKN